MAPKRRGRTSQAQSERPAKAPRIKSSIFSGVVEGIKLAGLPSTTTQMLLAGIPGALGTATKERHEVQVKIITILEEVLQGVEDKMQGAVDAASGQAAELNGLVEAQKAKCDLAEKALRAAAATSMENIQALEEAAAKVRAAEAALEQHIKAKGACDDQVSQSKQKKEAFDTCTASHFNPLVEGAWDVGGPQQHQQILMPVLETLGLEESLLIAAPKSLLKPLSSRSAFDAMVFEELRKGLDGRAAELGKKLAEVSAQAQERVVEVEAASSKLDGMRADHKAAAAGSAAAKLHEQEVSAAFAAEQAALEGMKSKLEEMAADQNRHLEVLENFKNYNLACFELLRDGQPILGKADAAAPAMDDTNGVTGGA